MSGAEGVRVSPGPGATIGVGAPGDRRSRALASAHRTGGRWARSLSFAAVAVLFATPGSAQLTPMQFPLTPADGGGGGHAASSGHLGHPRSSDADRLLEPWGFGDRLVEPYLGSGFGYADRLGSDLGSGYADRLGSVTLPDAPSPTRLLLEREAAAPDCWRHPCWSVLPRREHWQRQKSQADFWRSPLHWGYRERQRSYRERWEQRQERWEQRQLRRLR